MSVAAPASAACDAAVPGLLQLCTGALIRPILALPPAPGGSLLQWPAAAVAGAWRGAPVERPLRHGPVRYASSGPWLHGCIEIDETQVDGGLEAAARRAYLALFEVLARHRRPHLLRLWNYLADINGLQAGSERYQRFNVGRQQAFFEARHDPFEGAPAACALGLEDGPLRVFFLAGQHPPRAIENPRQVSAYRYPTRYGPSSPSFSRAALVDASAGRHLLLVSGTASIVGHASVHPGDVRRQTEESLANIAALRGLAGDIAGATFPAERMVHTVYLRRPADLPAVREVFERHVGRDSAAAREALYVRADVCRAELLVEIEAHGLTEVAG